MNKISIITVVYNDVTHIKDTIESVLSQTYLNIEYIVIDGYSSDGTIDIINNYLSRIYYFVSEKDLGIYDAMNKGIKAATGNWLMFLNSGDTLYQETTLAEIAPFLNSNFGVVYGDVAVISEEFEFSYNQAAKNIDAIKETMVMNHQACVFERNWHSENLYSLNFKIASDYNFILKSYLKGIEFLKIPVIVSKIITGGLSDSNRIKTFKETLNIKRKLNPSLGNYLFFAKQVTYSIAINLLKTVISKRLFARLYKKKYNLS